MIQELPEHLFTIPDTHPLFPPENSGTGGYQTLDLYNTRKKYGLIHKKR